VIPGIYSHGYPVCWSLASMEIYGESLFIWERILASRWLAMNFLLWLHYSRFQAVFNKSLPSNGHIRHNISAGRYNGQSVTAPINNYIEANYNQGRTLKIYRSRKGSTNELLNSLTVIANTWHRSVLLICLLLWPGRHIRTQISEWDVINRLAV
jgi:hypothetical protein